MPDIRKNAALPRTVDPDGHTLHAFDQQGHPCQILAPETPLPGAPWVWRAEFFRAFPQVDDALLQKGWHLAYCALSDLYGCPQAMESMKAFQDEMETLGFSKKPVLFGFSRGGLYAFNYAAQYPQRVGALYLDAPVLDIRSWPGGLGKGVGSPREWEDCMKLWGLDANTAQTFQGNPLDRVETVVKAGIPMVLVAGDADDVVPWEENGALLLKKVRQLGGRIEVILKPGCGHHPHSVEDPAPVVQWIEEFMGI